MSMLYGRSAGYIVLPVILFMVGVPLLQMVFVCYWVAVHQIVLLDGVDIDTEMLSHESHSKAVSESPDLVRLTSHSAVNEEPQR